MKFDEVMPSVLRIMRLQSEQTRLAILDGLAANQDRELAFRELVTAADEVSGLKKVSANSISHFVVDLEREGLIRRTERGYTVDAPGLAAIRAFNEYQNGLMEPLFKALLTHHVGAAGAHGLEHPTKERLLDLMTGGRVRAVPAVLRLLRLQSDPARLALLMHMSNSDGLAPLADLRAVAEDVLHKKVPASTLSNFLSELEGEKLISREDSSQVALTELGLEANKKFEEYHTRLAPTMITSVSHLISQELGLGPEAVEAALKGRAPSNKR